MRKILTAIAMSAVMLAGANATTAQEATTDSVETPVANDESTTNPMNWLNSVGQMHRGHIEPFNPADPASWMKIVDPATHTKIHATFTNPAGYAQFMDPQLYMSMMNPTVWMKWMNPESYKVMMSPETMKFWVQPGSYAHTIQATQLTEMINPESYSKLMESAVKAMTTTPTQTSGFNFFSPAAWANAFSQAANSASTVKSDDKG